MDQISRGVFHDFDDVAVKGAADSFEIGKDPGLLRIEAASDDVFGVETGQPVGLFEREPFFKVIFLIVGHLDDDDRIEGRLQILGEHERDHVAKMERFGTGPAAGVEVDLFPFLVGIEHQIKVFVGEENAAAEPGVGPHAGHFFKTADERPVDGLAPELPDHFQIVDPGGRCHFPRCNFCFFVHNLCSDCTFRLIILADYVIYLHCKEGRACIRHNSSHEGRA